jgi:large subunit ribosomal protein L12
MEYIYAALLLNKAGQEVTESNVKKVLHAAGVEADEARLRALTAALDGVNIDEAIRNAAAAPAAGAAPAAAPAAAKAEEKKEEKNEEAAAEGLGSLFG